MFFSITGDVVLKDLKLKAEALNNLKLPVTVKAGFVGTITLKVVLLVVISCKIFIFFFPCLHTHTHMLRNNALLDVNIGLVQLLVY